MYYFSKMSSLFIVNDEQLNIWLTLKMKALRFVEISVPICHSTRRNFPKYHNLLKDVVFIQGNVWNTSPMFFELFVVCMKVVTLVTYLCEVSFIAIWFM